MFLARPGLSVDLSDALCEKLRPLRRDSGFELSRSCGKEPTRCSPGFCEECSLSKKCVRNDLTPELSRAAKRRRLERIVRLHFTDYPDFQCIDTGYQHALPRNYRSRGAMCMWSFPIRRIRLLSSPMQHIFV